jgi:hypothetical protein
MQSEGAHVNQIVPEIVRIGVAKACIKCVAPQRLEYFDEAGQECFVDLEECARNRVRDVESWRDDGARKSDYSLVAKGGFQDDSPYIEFMNNRRTRFEFESLEARQELKSLLVKARWRVLSAF